MQRGNPFPGYISTARAVLIQLIQRHSRVRGQYFKSFQFVLIYCVTNLNLTDFEGILDPASGPLCRAKCRGGACDIPTNVDILKVQSNHKIKNRPTAPTVEGQTRRELVPSI